MRFIPFKNFYLGGYPWPRVLSLPRRFVGDPASLALDNIYIQRVHDKGCKVVGALPLGDWISEQLGSYSKSNMSIKGNGHKDKLQPFTIKLVGTRLLKFKHPVELCCHSGWVKY